VIFHSYVSLPEGIINWGLSIALFDYRMVSLLVHEALQTNIHHITPAGGPSPSSCPTPSALAEWKVNWHGKDFLHPSQLENFTPV